MALLFHDVCPGGQVPHLHVPFENSVAIQAQFLNERFGRYLD